MNTICGHFDFNHCWYYVAKEKHGIVDVENIVDFCNFICLKEPEPWNNYLLPINKCPLQVKTLERDGRQTRPCNYVPHKVNDVLVISFLRDVGEESLDVIILVTTEVILQTLQCKACIC